MRMAGEQWLGQFEGAENDYSLEFNLFLHICF